MILSIVSRNKLLRESSKIPLATINCIIASLAKVGACFNSSRTIRWSGLKHQKRSSDTTLWPYWKYWGLFRPWSNSFKLLHSFKSFLTIFSTNVRRKSQRPSKWWTLSLEIKMTKTKMRTFSEETRCTSSSFFTIKNNSYPSSWLSVKSFTMWKASLSMKRTSWFE